ncbi:MAG: hypothetical protein WCX32_02745 [Clostridia bacterium]|jgi:predicted  nucleic acid-binding Zn-ribbon protein|nr:hypothetical protein [Clostridia bacterium]
MLDNAPIDKILKYQELDREVLKLERELFGSDAKKNINNAVQFVKDAQNKSINLEREAKDLIVDYENLNKTFEDNFKKAQILYTRETESLKEEELKLFLSQISAVSVNLSIIERKLFNQSQKVEEILKNFEDTKNSIMKARKLHSDSKEVYQKIAGIKEPMISKLKKQLAELETSIDKKIMDKYKAARQDHIFPVFVPLAANSSCGACGMQIPSSKMTILKSSGIMDCEHCRRIIYQII